MVCYSPVHGFRRNGGGFTTSITQSATRTPLTVACGQCIGCRLARSLEWAIRCQHEKSLYDHNHFITLTYSDANLPASKSVDVGTFQSFMKKFRNEYGSGIRYFHCGEYGDKLARPHYHALLFNVKISDLIPWKKSARHLLYVSPKLTELWGLGYCYLGAVTFQSSAYVARYITKKVNGPISEEHYTRIHPETGEVYQVMPPYVTMSRRKGLGEKWLEKNWKEVYPADFIVMENKKISPPRYYDKWLEANYPEIWRKVRSARMRNAEKHSENNTPERLLVRETVQQRRMSLLLRDLE